MSRNRRRRKSFDFNWKPIGGHQKMDVWGAIKPPTKLDLVSFGYQGHSGNCVSLISNRVGAANLCCYIHNPTKTKKGFALPPKKKAYIEKRHRNAADDLQEVMKNPLMDLLAHPNPHSTKTSFLRGLQTQLDLTGTAYIHLIWNQLDLPMQLWILPTTYMQPKTDHGKLIGYDYTVSLPAKFIPLKDVIVIKYDNPEGCQLEGISPIYRAWSNIMIGLREQSYLLSVYENEAQPRTLVSVDDDIDYFAADRFQKSWQERYQKTGNSGVMFVGKGMTVAPLNYRPKDVISRDLMDLVKTSVLNAFMVPPAYFDASESNRAIQMQAERDLGENCLMPRLMLIEEGLQRIANMFDENLIVLFDNPIPDDVDLELEKDKFELTKINALIPLQSNYYNGTMPKQAAVNTAMLSLNIKESEALELFPDKPPEPTPEPEPEPKDNIAEASALLQMQMAVEGGQLSRQAAMASAVINFAMTMEQANLLFPETVDETPIAETNDLRATVGGSQQIMALQLAVESGEMDRTSAIANARIVFGFTAEESSALFPDIPIKAPISPPEPTTPPEPKPEPEPASKQKKASKKPSLKKLIAVLRTFFAHQKAAVLHQLSTVNLETVGGKSVLVADDYRTQRIMWKAQPPDNIINLDHFAEAFQKDMRPLIEVFYDYSAQQVISRNSFAPDLFSVVQPKIKESLDAQLITLSEETQQTTSLAISDAIVKVKEELQEGLQAGEERNLLISRVNEVFDGASRYRSEVIARTESQKALNNAVLMVSAESGLVKGHRLQLSAQPCQICQDKAEDYPEVPLGETFGNNGFDEPAYAPPFHCACECSLIEVLKDPVEETPNET